MKLISVYTSSHKILRDEWFLPTLKDDYEVTIDRCEVSGEGKYMESDWTDGVLFKCTKILEAIKKNMGDVFVYADVDIEFFSPTRELILEAIEHKDIVCQADDPNGNLCTGSFAVRANDRTLKLWQEVYQAIYIEHRDQHAFNRIIRQMKDIRFGYLPSGFFGAGTFTAKVWEKGWRFYIPKNPVMFHANWTIGLENKISLLDQARKIINRGYLDIVINNTFVFLQDGRRLSRPKDVFSRT